MSIYKSMYLMCLCILANEAHGTKDEYLDQAIKGSGEEFLLVPIKNHAEHC